MKTKIEEMAENFASEIYEKDSADRFICKNAFLAGYEAAAKELAELREEIKRLKEKYE